MTKPMPLFFGTRDRKCSKASNPPAEAPMPTMGNGAAAVETGAVWGAARGNFPRRRFGLKVAFTFPFPATPAPEVGRFAGCEARDGRLALGMMMDLEFMREP